MRVCVFVESKFDVEYGCVMKLTLTHRHHQPSPSFTSLVKQRIESRSDLSTMDALYMLERAVSN